MHSFSRWTNLTLWALCCTVAGLLLLIYLPTSRTIGQGETLMPLDDAYIHFQYARQIAEGHPYHYNTDDPATSGATSFLYPYVLAAGYKLGFTGLNLGLWAMGIGALALAAGLWILIQIARALGFSPWWGFFIGLTFALSGSVSWHYFSGMETGLMMTFTLAVLYVLLRKDQTMLVIGGILLALTRPEGSIMAALAVSVYAIGPLWQIRRSPAQILRFLRKHWPLALPIAAAAIQPLLNFALTGSFSAAGSQAKSILGMVPFDVDVALERILDNFTRMGEEFALGTFQGSAGDFTPLFIPVLGLFGLVVMTFSKNRRGLAILIILWLVMISAAISTLDTAFWHFKRYQMPLIALFYPLALYGGGMFWRQIAQNIYWANPATADRRRKALETPRFRLAVIGLGAVILLAFALPTTGTFLRLYHVNLENIAAQPLPMAHWLQANTPENALIAVHDVGMMRYVGGRKTLDMVGLTTPDAADDWSNGPGAVAEFLLNHAPPPDYVAAYTTARGLNYLAETALYGELLAGFPADFAPEDNVALAADFQGIYRVTVAEDTGEYSSGALRATTWLCDTPTPDCTTPVDAVNVAAIEAENAHGYQWHDAEIMTSFTTEVYQMTYPACGESPCTVIDGGRRINGEESFTLQTIPGKDALLVTRIHPGYTGTIDIYANDQLIDTQWIPLSPGLWMDITTLIPADHIADGETYIRIVPHTPGGHYMPYHHWLFQGDFAAPEISTPEAIATYQDGAFDLAYTLQQDNERLNLNLFYRTDGTAHGDYKIFVHIYDDADNPPVTQADGYMQNNPEMIPGNWLPGVIEDQIVVNLAEIPPGEYQVAVGFYEATTFDRLLPTAPNTPADSSIIFDTINRRLFIGTIEVTNHG